MCVVGLILEECEYWKSVEICMEKAGDGGSQVTFDTTEAVRTKKVLNFEVFLLRLG